MSSTARRKCSIRNFKKNIRSWKKEEQTVMWSVRHVIRQSISVILVKQRLKTIWRWRNILMRWILNAKSQSHKVTSYFASSKDYTIAACEGVWTYHFIKASHSFRSSDCASKIFRTCFEMKMFHCARTKCESIATNVLAPFALDAIKMEMATVNYINIATDASNHGNIKMLPVLARYFIPTIGVRVKVLEFSFEKGETSIMIANLLKRTAEKLEIKSKVVSFCGDNCATNFGSDERGGENNVYYHLQQWKQHLIGTGCAAHVVQMHWSSHVMHSQLT